MGSGVMRSWAAWGSGFVATVERGIGGWLDLAIRLWLAQAFLAARVHTMMAGGGAPDVGFAIQTAGAALLAIGLLSRPVALALAVEAMLSAGADPDARLFWTALLVRIVVLGPGRIALDRLVGRGLAHSPLPAAAAVQPTIDWVRRCIGPLYQLALRVWVAAAPAGLALAALSVTSAMRPGVAPWLPHVPAMVASLAPLLALALAALLATGTATRLAALALLTLVPLGQIAVVADTRLPWSLLLAVLVIYGAGPLSIDALVARRLRRMTAPADLAGLPHVVIVGGGFGGVAAAQGLARAACRMTLIDERNHNLFQPLLYQVATASLSPGDIAVPIREMFRTQANVRVLLGKVTGVDTAGRAVLLGDSRIGYDTLVLATGARHGYFGRNDWEQFAPGLKSVEDATTIRRRLLLAFEEAENADDEATRRPWLTFVVVGGGPTGVEMAGAIAELARTGLAREFRRIDPASARVILVQSGDRLLPAFPQSLSRDAERTLRELGVELRLDQKVDGIDADRVTIGGDEIPARTVLWAAGVTASGAAAWLGQEPDKSGRVKVAADLSVPGLSNVFALGDTAASDAWGGKPVPGLAPAAKQGGAYVARVIRARLAGRPAPKPFRYRHFGSLATIGRQSAVADFGFVRLHGAIAWWLWGAAHIAFLVDGRHRVSVLVQWLWAYLTFRRGTRLITESR